MTEWRNTPEVPVNCFCLPEKMLARHVMMLS